MAVAAVVAVVAVKAAVMAVTVVGLWLWLWLWRFVDLQDFWIVRKPKRESTTFCDQKTTSSSVSYSRQSTGGSGTWFSVAQGYFLQIQVLKP